MLAIPRLAGYAGFFHGKVGTVPTTLFALFTSQKIKKSLQKSSKFKRIYYSPAIFIKNGNKMLSGSFGTVPTVYYIIYQSKEHEILAEKFKS
ncbi:MAG: hypothetical protein LBU32_06740 [Clostridiales bacterium]|jgi:hypothetical protein|nr:hypothetical protein [Clostridiales bacterium]